MSEEYLLFAAYRLARQRLYNPFPGAVNTAVSSIQLFTNAKFHAFVSTLYVEEQTATLPS